MNKVNIAIAGGPCTGKSVLATHLFSHLKMEGFDYDLVQEECRKLKKEFGAFTDPFERFYFWIQQEREELRSIASNGFVTDKPLFHYYAQVKQFSSSPRDKLAYRELFRMSMELGDRYQLIIMAEDPEEVPYKIDQSRISKKEMARERHQIVRSFVDHMWPEKLLLVNGGLEARTNQAMEKIKEIHQAYSTQ